ncbi:response regulator FixJ [Flaviflagellibacter deserti]|uniref:Response regulator FixJ n=1 Tax=Flaviflagellibacter deserti TaxID=2267266 RepID=A0ABV9Z473_9HYPH
MADDSVVCVVDDDAGARQSLSFLLGMAGMKAEAFEAGPHFLESRAADICKCLIADVRMPLMSGIELLDAIKARRPELSVIVITGHGDVPLAVEAMKSGAADFIEKPFDNERLLSSVRAAISQPSEEMNPVKAAIEERLNTLSSRERQVLMSLVRGNPNKIVAYELGISARTVEIHRAHVMSKMQAKSLADLVRFALVAGCLNEPG